MPRRDPAKAVQIRDLLLGFFAGNAGYDTSSAMAPETAALWARSLMSAARDQGRRSRALSGRRDTPQSRHPDRVQR
jgi:hypothetical protein